MHENWPSLYQNKKLGITLMVYVDDFRMGGPPSGFKTAWGEIRKRIDMDDPTPLGTCLGCQHNEIKVTLDDGSTVRGMEWDMTSQMRQCVELYQQCAGPNAPKLKIVDSSFHPVLRGPLLVRLWPRSEIGRWTSQCPTGGNRRGSLLRPLAPC